MEAKKGILYLGATPIGNLEDMTFRAVRMLKEADLIAAEDTRHTRQLLNHFEIHGKPMLSYHENNKEKAGPVLLQALEEGKNVVLVSDAGFPGISDPGEAAAKDAIAHGFLVVPIPGANAALTALVASGLGTTPFFFGGFLPKTKKKRIEQLEAWKTIPATLILYEAPHRIREVLQDIKDVWGDRDMAMCRELTKIHEEFFRGSIAEVRQHLEESLPRGEFVLVIAPEKAEPAALTEDPLVVVKQLVANGMDKKEALAQTAKQYKVPKRELYNRLVREKAAQGEYDGKVAGSQH